MRVKPSQLVPGCMLINDVTGKTGHPLIPKETILTEEHIEVLQRFLVETVHVSPKMRDGELFIPKKITEEPQEQVPIYKQEIDQRKNSITDHYLTVVTEYKELYKRWKNVLKIDMPEVRELLIPLYKRADDIAFDIFDLYTLSRKEDYIYHHSVAVGFLSTYLARKMGYAEGESLQIGLAGFLSDCGMVRIDHSIIKKSGSLTPRQWTEIKKHPTYSYHLIKNARTISQPVKTAVIQHHERLDGSGYPLGVSNEKVHFYARIIAVCDMYHAMTSERVYKESTPLVQVIELMQTKQFSELDPKVVQTFLRMMADSLIGKRVQLSNEQIGEIIFISEAKNVTRPIVKIEETDEIISLENRLLSISEILGS